MKKTGLITFMLSVSILMISCSKEEVDPVEVADFVTIRDADFEQILIEKGIDSDGIVNQQISEEDAQKVTRLNLNFSNISSSITDLSGIEAFTNLTFLSANQQELEEIDLSLNTKIDTLSLVANYLGAIDLSHNTRLRYVDLISNELTSINGISALDQLKTLKLSYNYMENFSVNNESLESLLISDNLLKEIDISGAPNLKSLLLTLNELTSLDLYSNTKLERLVASANELSSIDLSSNVELNYFYASSNALTSLDVSQNQKLVDLRIDRNPDLSCIKIESGQEIPTVSLDSHQQLSDSCS